MAPAAAYHEHSGCGGGFTGHRTRRARRLHSLLGRRYRLGHGVRSGRGRSGRVDHGFRPGRGRIDRVDHDGHRVRSSRTLQEDDDEPVHADTAADHPGLRAHRIGKPQDDGHVGADDQQHGPERGYLHDRAQHGVRPPAQGQVRQLRLRQASRRSR